MSVAPVLSDRVPAPRDRHVRGLTFEAVQSEAHARGALALPDQVVEASDLHATEEGAIEVPNLGALSLTDWSRDQLARLLGIRWGRWFSDDFVDDEERAEELNRRFARSMARLKVRARRFAPGEHPPGKAPASSGPS